MTPSIEIARGNLIAVPSTVKVNSMNGDGVLGSGIAGAFRKACPSLQSDLKTLILSHGGGYPTGSVMWTHRPDGYPDLQCEAVAHVVTMRHPGQQSSPAIIQQCFDSLIADLRQWPASDDLRTVALCAWGTGVGRVPIETVARILLDGILTSSLSGWRWVIHDPNPHFIHATTRRLTLHDRSSH